MSEPSRPADTRTADILNISLIGLSWGLALFIPFPLNHRSFANIGKRLLPSFRSQPIES